MPLADDLGMKSLFVFLLFCLPLVSVAQIKNSQDILGGLLTRAGVAKRQPLTQGQLVALCESGYTQAFFLYGGAKDQTVKCDEGEIRYRSLKDFRMPENMNLILNNVQKGFSTGERTFVHCNNGAHASGYVGAIALRSFCGVESSSAVTYWDRTLGGYPLQEPNRSSLMRRLVNYPIRAELELSSSDKSKFGCP